ncbi:MULTISPECIES: PEP-CTERM sorting domain-containing protein [Methylomonas]|nr:MULTISPECIES: PEP-CTERM sorting domain-containing protein [Methylomonas]
MAAGVNAHASLTAGDIAFTAFNADEDGLAFTTFKDIQANTNIYFADNEWTGSAFNTGESYNVWNSGASLINAGSVIRFSAYDKSTLSASAGLLNRVTVSGSANWGLANSSETVYAYLGTSATVPTTFLTAVTNGDFAVDGSLASTGLTEGVNAIRLNKNTTSATPDYAEYIGIRSGLTSFDAYKGLVANVNNWTVDTTNGAYAATIPNTASFSVAAVPVPGAVWLFSSALLGFLGVRRKA